MSTRLLAPLLLLAFFSVQGGLLRAEIVRDLYSAEVPVADQGSQALASASRDALAEVLIKVSGSSAVLANPEIRGALSGASQRVEQYGYRPGDEPDELYAWIEFDSGYITDLVTGAGEPLWTANRPGVLVWLVLEDETGRNFVSREGDTALAEELQREFSRRGVPLRFPLFDLTDAAALSIQEAWKLYGPALQSASQRYRVENVLAGRLAALSSGDWAGEWVYFHEGERIDRSSNSPSSQAFIREGAALVAESMAARYAVLPILGEGDQLTLSISGVERYADYAAIVTWLEQLELVDHANVEQIRGDEILVRLYAQADAAQLASVIELNRRFQPVPVTAGSPLSYQWLKN